MLLSIFLREDDTYIPICQVAKSKKLRSKKFTTAADTIYNLIVDRKRVLCYTMKRI